MVKKNRFMILLMMFAVLFSGCLFGVETVNELVISADASLVQQGNSVNLEVKGFDKKNKEVEIKSVEWSLKDSTKGTLVSDGATAVFTVAEDGEGKVIIEAKSAKVTTSIEITITTEDLADRSYLKDAIDAAKELKQNTASGTDPGQIKPEDHTVFQNAIEAAEAIYNNADATEEQVAAAFNALGDAVAVFEAAYISGDSYFDRTDWKGNASNNGSSTDAAFDGDASTRWHASRQQVDKWLEIDLGSDQTFNLITLNSEGSPTDLPRGFELFVAADGESPDYGEPVYEGGFPREQPDGIGDIVFEEMQTARWFKIVLTVEDYDKYFAIHELYVGTRY